MEQRTPRKDFQLLLRTDDALAKLKVLEKDEIPARLQATMTRNNLGHHYCSSPLSGSGQTPTTRATRCSFTANARRTRKRHKMQIEQIAVTCRLWHGGRQHMQRNAGEHTAGPCTSNQQQKTTTTTTTMFTKMLFHKAGDWQVPSHTRVLPYTPRRAVAAAITFTSAFSFPFNLLFLLFFFFLRQYKSV